MGLFGSCPDRAHKVTKEGGAFFPWHDICRGRDFHKRVRWGLDARIAYIKGFVYCDYGVWFSASNTGDIMYIKVSLGCPA